MDVRLFADGYHLFAEGVGDQKSWTLADIVLYLMGEYASRLGLAIPNESRLKALFGDEATVEIDLTGLNLLEALYKCAKTAGLEYKFYYGQENDAIVFYRPGRGRVVGLNAQYSGQMLDAAVNQVFKYKTIKTAPATHRFIGHGDNKQFEASFELVKGWDASKESNDFTKFSPATNANFTDVKDVYRKWVLNEANDYSGSPYNAPAMNLESVFGNGNFLRKKRRFWPALSQDDNGKSMGYYLEVSYTNGQKWWQYMYAFDLLLDECGIWLSSEHLDLDTWWAAIQGAMRVRLTATIIGDERLEYIYTRGAMNSSCEVVDHLFTFPRQFKYKEITSDSRFYNALHRPGEIDNSNELASYVRRQAENYEIEVARSMVETGVLEIGYEVGDSVVCGPAGRDMLGIGYGEERCAVLKKVTFDMAQQKTVLEISTQRR